MGKKSPTYKDSGVDIAAGDLAVERIKEKVRRTFDDRVLTNIGGFGGLYSLKDYPAREPVLVSATDGVGTKLKIAFMMDKHDTVGIDAVAMCVNDVITCGARPLFFLDYIGTGKLKPDVVESIVDGLAEGCIQAGCALIGGEMAEMPGVYSEGEYDLVGFSVGMIDRDGIIDGAAIREGDRVLGLASSGLHSNGFSLVRRVVFEMKKLKPEDRVEDFERPLGEVLLEPTRIYAGIVRELTEKFAVRGLAHITGGGLEGNIIRILPPGLAPKLDWGGWDVPPVFNFLQKAGGIEEKEMRKVFNLGIGMAVVVGPDIGDEVAAFLSERDGKCFDIGRVEAQ